MINLEVRDRQLLISVHGNGAFRVWDLPSQKRVFLQALLEEALLETTIPIKIAAVPLNERRSSQGLDSQESAVNLLIVFGARNESSMGDSHHQVSLSMFSAAPA